MLAQLLWMVRLLLNHFQGHVLVQLAGALAALVVLPGLPEQREPLPHLGQELAQRLVVQQERAQQVAESGFPDLPMELHRGYFPVSLLYWEGDR